MGFNIITTTVQVETFCLYGLTFSHNYGLEAQKQQAMTTTVDTIIRNYASHPALNNNIGSHSEAVSQKALSIAKAHPELEADLTFLEEAAMLHDIGIVKTDAPGIECYGTEPYICHGILGAAMLRDEGLPRHARVCERHTGAGLLCEDIVGQNLPLPHHDFLPETIEEHIE